MNIKSICKSRRIRKIDVETPLLVPSFSSVVYDIKVSEVHEKLTDLITEASLVSAYDLHHGFIDKGNIWVSEVVFIDSGNLEVNSLKDLGIDVKDWSASTHSDVISSLDPISKIILVNYDEKKPLKRQISSAHDLFSKFPDHAACFLCKPSKESMNLTYIQDLVDDTSLIEPFDVLGFTEKELGNSLLHRCQNLLKVRNALYSKNLTTPIHIFGCLDPLSILSYFFCGADIFDGTSWLKYSFHEYIAIYTNNYPFLEKGSWSDTDSLIRASTCAQNLRELTRLMYRMRSFTQEYNFDLFRMKKEILKEVKDLVRVAGLNVR